NEACASNEGFGGLSGSRFFGAPPLPRLIAIIWYGARVRGGADRRRMGNTAAKKAAQRRLKRGPTALKRCGYAREFAGGVGQHLMLEPQRWQKPIIRSARGAPRLKVRVRLQVPHD